jgi:U4/U6.U5 small nuclear ribonucleoproteins
LASGDYAGAASKDELEAARRARMARLRAENEDEEQTVTGRGSGANGGSTKVDTSRQSGVVDASELEGLDDDEQMRIMLGFDGFGSTKNTKVDDNHATSARGAAAKNKARKYRQYMNRKVRVCVKRKNRASKSLPYTANCLSHLSFRSRCVQNGFNRPLDKMN